MTALGGALTVDTKSPPPANREDRKEDEATTTTTTTPFGPVSTETPQRNVRQATRTPK